MHRTITKELGRVKMRMVWSASGFRHVWRTEGSLMQWIVVNAIMVLPTLVLPLTAGERGMLLMGGILVLAMECMNTAIERVVDDISTERRVIAKQAKDCGSAAVAVTAIAWGVAWVCVLIGLVV